jgi:hypothetical protein
MPPFAEPFISGEDAGLELAAVLKSEDRQKGLSRFGWRRLVRVTAA